jgi:hypothetical protein
MSGSPPPVLAGTTLKSDQYPNSALLILFEVGTFGLVAQIMLDCTAAGGTVSQQQLTVTGTYTRGGSTLTVQVPGASPIPATYNGTTLTGTIPTSPVTFPIALDVVLSQRAPAMATQPDRSSGPP